MEDYAFKGGPIILIVLVMFDKITLNSRFAGVLPPKSFAAAFVNPYNPKLLHSLKFIAY